VLLHGAAAAADAAGHHCADDVPPLAVECYDAGAAVD
jgi:hypothetical protein